MIIGRNFKRHSKKGDYMPVANCPVLNMVSAVIDDYKRSPKRLKTIFLNQRHWRLFVEDLKRVDDSYPINATEGVPIADSDVTVKLGSMFQSKEMQYEFYANSIEIPIQKQIATA